MQRVCKSHLKSYYFTAIVTGNLNKVKAFSIVLTLNRWHPLRIKITLLKWIRIFDICLHVGYIYHAHYFHSQYFSSQKDSNQKQLKPHNTFSSLKVFGCKKQSHTTTTVVLNMNVYLSICISIYIILRMDVCQSCASTGGLWYPATPDTKNEYLEFLSEIS